MSLESFVAQLNSMAFWREFTFSQNKFTPKVGSELELADNLVWLGDHALILQLKERTEPSDDPEVERSWFKRKVLDRGVRQVRDTLQYLRENQSISVKNDKGDSFDIRGAEFKTLTKIIVFLGSSSLPDDCRQTRFYISSTAGFIHIVPHVDYLGIIEKLRVPEDIRRYFGYREAVVAKLAEAGTFVGEQDIMGGFLREEELPNSNSGKALERFIQDFDSFDISSLIGGLSDHIEHSEDVAQYYRIMLEFARLPRSVWREVKVRFVKSVEIAKAREFAQPYRVTFPTSDCTFMISPIPPEVPSTGEDGRRARANGLQAFTYAAKYLAKTSKGVGILVSVDGEYFQIDWCLIDQPWEPDAELDAKLAENSPFRTVSEQYRDSFLFRS